ncbi:hypothetical protein BG006_011418, partial [Podila minutissima]
MRPQRLQRSSGKLGTMQKESVTWGLNFAWKIVACCTTWTEILFTSIIMMTTHQSTGDCVISSVVGILK